MMAELVKIPYEGGFADAEHVDIEKPGTVTSKVDLPDGNALRLDMSVNDIFRLVDKTDEKGQPVYVFNLQVKVTPIPKTAVEPETEKG